MNYNIIINSSDGLGRRLQTVGRENTYDARQEYRQMLYSNPKLSEHISAIILDHEAVTQKSENGVLFPKLLAQNNIIPGVCVDMGKNMNKI